MTSRDEFDKQFMAEQKAQDSEMVERIFMGYIVAGHVSMLHAMYDALYQGKSLEEVVMELSQVVDAELEAQTVNQTVFPLPTELFPYRMGGNDADGA
jgi:hypothetical protein